MEKRELKENIDDSKFIENNEINDISTTSTKSIIEYGVNEERFIVNQKNDNEIKQLDISDDNIILEEKKQIEKELKNISFIKGWKNHLF